VTAESVSTVEGYRFWAPTYDDPGNGAFPVEEPYVKGFLAGLPVGTALDAACGTGRWSEHLAAEGWQVIGVDSSPEMLARARPKVPQGEFLDGTLQALPLPDAHVDLVLCALALTHVRDLAPVITEFARVLRPGGHLIISDMHEERIAMGSVPSMRSATGEPGLQSAYRHQASDYLKPALAAGLQLRGCEEPRIPSDGVIGPAMPETIDVGPWDIWPWSLLDIVPAAGKAVGDGSPATVIWHFQRS
jgi:SAM-dependent methyltransferase